MDESQTNRVPSHSGRQGAARWRGVVGVLVSVLVVAGSFFGAFAFSSSLRAATEAQDDTTSGVPADAASSEHAGESTQTSGSASTPTSEASLQAADATSETPSSRDEGQEQGRPEARTEPSRGIDVSEIQGQIDWSAVHADGIDFVFVRVGYRGTSEGELFEDERFANNIAGAQKVGLRCGAYFYSQAANVKEAIEEARFVVKALDGVELELPVVFDYEVVNNAVGTRVGSISVKEATDVARAFCSAIERAGYTSMIYGNAWDLALYDLDELEDWPVWYAEYVEKPSYSGVYDFWQYSNAGWVEGIDIEVDLNLDMRTVAGSKAYAEAHADPNALPELFWDAESSSSDKAA